jgi:hypothetical protein
VTASAASPRRPAGPASAGRPRRLARAAAPWLALALLAGGCRTPSAPPPRAPIEPLAARGAIMPTDGDLAAADLAVAVLGDDRLAGLEALARIQAYEDALEEEDPPTGLPGYGRYALAATLDDPELYGEAMKNLLDDDGLDPGLEEMVEQERDDQPLKLARARVRDAWVRHLGTVFNHFAGPIGKSAATGAVAIAGFARSLFKVMLYELQREPMDTTERQALGHWKRFVERNPDADEAEDVIERIQENQRKWNQLQSERFVKAGERALERGQPRVALVMAERALQYREEAPDAMDLREKAQAKVLRWQEARIATEAAPESGDVAPDEARELALRLLVADPATTEAEAERLFLADPTGPLADEARFVMATMRGEQGNTEGMWAYLTAIGMVDPLESNMSRHAEASVRSTSQNPYRAFVLSRRDDLGDQAKWVLFGPLAGGPEDRSLPRPVEWLIDLPTFVELFASLPNRLVAFPWMQPWPFGKAPAAFARRYLERYPEGRRFDDVAAWLQDWEERRGNHVGAFEIALLRSDVGDGDLRGLEEKAAQQMLDAAAKEPRMDARLYLLEGITREHPDTEAGRKAGRRARELARQITPQRIRLSRGFLEEHRFLAGPDGIGLEPIFLDGDPRNGELHPEGVSIVSDRTLELSFLAASGDDDDEPERRYRTISEERMARLVSLVDETSLRLAQLESDYEHVPDAERDTFFETARLGVSSGPGVRSAARSEYAFEGMREQYGLVRSRESILPFELVVQGSLYDFGFGVFPRIRMPKPTPDAFLYR